MAYIEKNRDSLVSVIHRLKKSGDGLEFLLFPMIHVGTQEFYDEVARRLAACDLVLAEGIKSPRAHLISLPYRVAAKSPRLKLVSQMNALKLSGFKDKIVAADLAGSAFDENWSQLRLRIRLLLLVVVPLSAIYLSLFQIDAAFVERYQIQVVGSATHEELWVPAEELAEFNQHIIGPIEVIASFGRVP